METKGERPRANVRGAEELLLSLDASGVVPAAPALVRLVRARRIGALALLSLNAERATTLTCADNHVAVLVEPGGSVVVDGPAGGALALAEGAQAMVLTLPRARLSGLMPQGVAPCFRFGEPGTAWPALIRYALEAAREAALGERLEEALLAELARNWPAPEIDPPAAMPRHVRVAEAFLRARAAQAPGIAEAARVAGVSERALSEGFRRFLGVTPGAYLRALRLDGVRAALETEEGSTSVAHVAMRWSYSNFGAFARAYAHRFGELPSVTLRRARAAASTRG